MKGPSLELDITANIDTLHKQLMEIAGVLRELKENSEVKIDMTAVYIKTKKKIIDALADIRKQIDEVNKVGIQVNLDDSDGTDKAIKKIEAVKEAATSLSRHLAEANKQLADLAGKGFEANEAAKGSTKSMVERLKADLESGKSKKAQGLTNTEQNQIAITDEKLMRIKKDIAEIRQPVPITFTIADVAPILTILSQLTAHLENARKAIDAIKADEATKKMLQGAKDKNQQLVNKKTFDNFSKGFEDAFAKADIGGHIEKALAGVDMRQMTAAINAMLANMNSQAKDKEVNISVGLDNKRITALNTRIDKLVESIKAKTKDIPVSLKLNFGESTEKIKQTTTAINEMVASVTAKAEVKDLDIGVTLDNKKIAGLKKRVDNLIASIKEKSKDIPVTLKLDIEKFNEKLKQMKAILDRAIATKRFKPEINADIEPLKKKLSAAKKALDNLQKSDATKIKITAVIADATAEVKKFNEVNKQVIDGKTIIIKADHKQFDTGIEHVKKELASLKDHTIYINSNVKDMFAKVAEAKKVAADLEKAKEEAQPKEESKKEKKAKTVDYNKMAMLLYDHPLSNGKTDEGNATVGQRLSAVKTLQSAAALGKTKPKDANAWLPDKKIMNFLAKEREKLEELAKAVSQNMTLAQARRVQKDMAAKAEQDALLKDIVTARDNRSKEKQEYSNRTTALNVKEQFQNEQARLNQNSRNKSLADTAIEQEQKAVTDASNDIRKQMEAVGKVEKELKKIQSKWTESHYGLQPMSQKSYMRYSKAEQELIDRLNSLNGSGDSHKTLFNGASGYKSYRKNFTNLATIYGSVAMQEANDKLANEIANKAIEARAKREKEEAAKKAEAERDAAKAKQAADRAEVAEAQRLVKLDEERAKAENERAKKQKAIANIAFAYSQELARQNQLIRSGTEIQQKDVDNANRKVQALRRQWDNAEWAGEGSKPELRQAPMENANAKEINSKRAVENAMAWRNQYFTTANDKVSTLTASLERMYTELKRDPGNTGLKQYISDTTAELRSARKEAKAVQEQMKMLSFGDMTKGLSRKMSWIAGAFGFYESYDILRKAGETITAIDEGMANLATVMPQLHHSQQEMIKEQGVMIDIASRYGSTIDDVIESARLWGRMYKDQETANLLSEQSTRLAIADNFSLGESTKAVEAAMFQYGLQAESSAEALAYSNRIIDVYTKLSHNAGVSAQDLAAGVERSGAVAHQAGMDFEFLTSLIAQGTRSTALSGSAIGTMLKTLVASFRSDKAVEELKKIDVQVKETQGGIEKFRDSRQILLDIALQAKYSDMDIQKPLLAISGGSPKFAA